MASDDENHSPSGPVNTSEMAALLIRHRSILMGYLVSCVRDYTDAEDLFQEVSLAAIRSAGDLRSADGFVPWAREIARRRVLSHFRKSKRLTLIDPELATRLAETAAEMDASMNVPARIEALHDCLDALPSQSSKLIALRYEAPRRPIEEIAGQFNRSVQAAYAILKRSRLLLRDCITQKLAAGS
ncbi:MAG: sigma-70 family RNA polymerase sigma factor [Verrucomicrobiales bacterium]|nr:sigma-70 family RNA polymerase sigma factor [Verrucomicrobiales bacterium]